MKRFAQFAMWAAALLFAVWLIDLTPEGASPLEETTLNLPDDSPDVYITGLQLTQFNAQGQKVMMTEAESMSVYNDSDLSRLETPLIQQLDGQQVAWRITAQEALLFSNEDIELINDVLILQQNVPSPIQVSSEWMRYAQATEIIETDRPVEVIQGPQTVTAVGMSVNLGTIEPVIQLLSDVNFYYDPS